MKMYENIIIPVSVPALKLSPVVSVWAVCVVIFWSANRWWWIVENRQNTKDKYVNVDWVNIYHAHGFDNTTKLVFAEQTIILIQPPQHNRLGSSQYSDFNGSNTIADTTAQCAVYQFKFKFFLLWMWQSNNINMYIQHARATWTFDRSDIWRIWKWGNNNEQYYTNYSALFLPFNNLEKMMNI